MKVCRDCGAPLRADAVECYRCGSKNTIEVEDAKPSNRPGVRPSQRPVQGQGGQAQGNGQGAGAMNRGGVRPGARPGVRPGQRPSQPNSNVNGGMRTRQPVGRQMNQNQSQSDDIDFGDDDNNVQFGEQTQTQGQRALKARKPQQPQQRQQAQNNNQRQQGFNNDTDDLADDFEDEGLFENQVIEDTSNSKGKKIKAKKAKKADSGAIDSNSGGSGNTKVKAKAKKEKIKANGAGVGSGDRDGNIDTGEYSKDMPTMKTYLIDMLIFMVPILGLVRMIKGALKKDGHPAHRAFYQAYLVLMGICVVFSIIISITMGSLFASMFRYLM